MIHRFNVLLAALWLSLAPALAQVGQIPAWPPLQPAPSAGGCTQATAFLARTSGLDGTHTTAYTNLICGLVTDGVWAKFDGLYIYATKNAATNGLLNLVQNAFNLTDSGTPATDFTDDRGYQPASTSLNTGYTPSSSGGLYAANDAHISVWSNSTTGSSFDAGVVSGGFEVSIQTVPVGSATGARVNNPSPSSSSSVATTATGKGFYLATRTAANDRSLYYNSGSSPYDVDSTSITAGLPTASIQFGATAFTAFGTKQLAAGSFGKGLTGTDAANFFSRLSAFMSAVGNP